MGPLSNAGLTRRSVVLNAAGAGLAPRLVCRRGFDQSRARRQHQAKGNRFLLVDMIRLLPDGIGVVPVYVNVTPASRDDGSVYPTYEERIAYLKSQKCNLIAIEGAPPFMPWPARAARWSMAGIANITSTCARLRRTR